MRGMSRVVTWLGFASVALAAEGSMNTPVSVEISRLLCASAPQAPAGPRALSSRAAVGGAPADAPLTHVPRDRPREEHHVPEPDRHAAMLPVQPLDRPVVQLRCVPDGVLLGLRVHLPDVRRAPPPAPRNFFSPAQLRPCL